MNERQCQRESRRGAGDRPGVSQRAPAIFSLEYHKKSERDSSRRQEGQSGVLLGEDRNNKDGTGQKGPQRREILTLQLQEKKNRQKNRQCAVAIIKGMRKDRVDSQENKRNAQQKCHEPRGGHFFIQQMKNDAPGKQGCYPSGQCSVNNVVKDCPAG